MNDFWKRYFDNLRQAIQRDDESVEPVHSSFERVSKWWLELVRNWMVVGAVSALAYRSDSLLLKLLAAISIGALCNFTMLPFNRYKIQLTHGVAPGGISEKIMLALGTLLTLTLTIWVSINVVSAFLVLFKAIAAVKN